MKLLMSKIEIEQFLKKEFPQVSQSFKILALDAGSIIVTSPATADPVSYTHLTLPTIYSV